MKRTVNQMLAKRTTSNDGKFHVIINIKSKHMKKYIVILLTTLISFGCDDFLSPNKEEGQSEGSFWQNSKHANQAMIAAYSALQAHDGSKWTFFEQMYIAATWKSDGILNAPTHYGQTIANFTNGADEPTFSAFWKSNYTGIAYANQVIENVPEIVDIEDAEKTELVAEAKFLRAVYHFNLLVAFENIPLITSTQKSTDEFLVSQVAPSVVWEQIEQDLEDAKAGLPATRSAENLGRATSWTASAYLGKAYLFQEKFGDAVTEFTNVVDNGPYDLLASYADNFNGAGENGVESVFEIQWSADRANGNDERHPMNFEVTPGALGGWELFYPSDWLLSEMMLDQTATAEYSDRVYASVFFDDPNSEMLDVYSGVSTPYADVEDDLGHPKYFKKYTGEFDKTYYNGINIHMMRFADVLLMQAEAMNEASAANTDAAIAVVNRVRTRSSAAEIAPGSMTQTELRQQIRHHERPVEMAMEYTIRLFDLYRWANGSAAPEPISATMAAHAKPFADNFEDGKHDIFPIPLEEMNKNKELNQNDGY